MRRLVLLLLFGLAIGAGLGAAFRLLPAREAPLPDPPAVVTQIREVARLEALDVRLYKKVSFRPEPTQADSIWGDLGGWLRHTFRTPEGKAIVFADAHLAVDLAKLDPTTVRVTGRTVVIALPPVRATVELRPGDTEILGSNLDSAEMAHLFELAKVAFEREVEADAGLRAKASGAAERAIRSLVLTMGFDEVRFVPALTTASAS